MTTYQVMAYLNKQLSPIDIEGETLPDAIHNLQEKYGEELSRIVSIKEAGFYMDCNGRFSGVPEII